MRKIQNTADGVAKFENVVKLSEFGQTVDYKNPDLPLTYCYCLFNPGRKMKQGSTSAKMNWVCRLAVRLTFQNIYAKYMAKIS